MAPSSERAANAFLCQALAGETIALEEVADGLWSLSFYTVELGRFHELDDQLNT